MQLEGNLAQFPISELIAMTVYSSVTGVLELGDQPPVQLFFRDGRLYHAVAGGASGVEAVCVAFTLDYASFRFVAGVVYQQETIWQDALDLIGYAEQRAAMWSRVKQHIPDFNWVPRLRQTSPTPRVAIDEAVWPVLAAVDGQRSVQMIGTVLSQDPLEVSNLLVDLVERRLVDVGRPRETGEQPCAPKAAPTSRGFFTRIMASSSHDELRG